MKFKEIEIKIKISAHDNATHYQVNRNEWAGYEPFYVVFWKEKNGKWFFCEDDNRWYEEDLINPYEVLTEISCAKKEIVKVWDWEIESYDILNKRTIIHNREALTKKEAMWFKTQGAKVRRIGGTEREIEK